MSIHVLLYDKVTLSEALNSKGGKRTKAKIARSVNKKKLSEKCTHAMYLIIHSSSVITNGKDL